MGDRCGLLREQWTDSCARLSKIVSGVTDAEFFWEPCAGCWTVHRRTEVRAASADGSGEWVIDYVVPDPEPAPVTTIAWRLVHIAAVNHLYWDYAFGSASLGFDLELPGSAEAAVGWLADSQAGFTRVLEELTEDDLDQGRLTNWGQTWPTTRIFTTLITEQTHHGAEISLLLDLYRNRDTGRY
ncbi:MAG TPA: DinB family protein [Microlunatus sp.]